MSESLSLSKIEFSRYSPEAKKHASPRRTYLNSWMGSSVGEQIDSGSGYSTQPTSSPDDFQVLLRNVGETFAKKFFHSRQNMAKEYYLYAKSDLKIVHSNQNRTSLSDFVLEYVEQTPEPTASDVAEIFQSHYAIWKVETEYLSSVQQMILHKSYLRIIGLGPMALPLILRKMQEESDHWFTALSAISGENPVPAELVGDMDKMTALWIDWGRSKNLI